MATDEGEDPGIPITAGGVTVRVMPLGWRDFVSLPEEYERVVAMPTDTDEQCEALRDAVGRLADRMDAYAVPGHLPPSRVPPRSMREFVDRWARGVRDAAVPPPSGAGSPSRRPASPKRRSR